MKGTGVCEWCGTEARNARWGSPQRYCSQTCGRNAARSRKRNEYRAVERVGERRRDLMRKFGITTKQYDSMLADQGGVCAICLSPPNGKLLAVDHNHSTGAVRGLLCGPCNMAFGVLEDHLKEVMSYVQST